MTEVLLQRCTGCGRWNIPELVRCPVDPGHRLVASAVGGSGVVFSYTITHVAMSPSSREHVPYVTALIELTEGPRLVAHFAGEASQVEIGMPVTISAVSQPTPHTPSGAMLATPQLAHAPAEIR